MQRRNYKVNDVLVKHRKLILPLPDVTCSQKYQSSDVIISLFRVWLRRGFVINILVFRLAFYEYPGMSTGNLLLTVISVFDEDKVKVHDLSLLVCWVLWCWFIYFPTEFYYRLILSSANSDFVFDGRYCVYICVGAIYGQYLYIYI